VHGLDGRQHLVDVVQGVEDAEDVHPVTAASVTNASVTALG